MGGISSSWDMALAGAGLVSWGGGVGALLSEVLVGRGSPGAGRMDLAETSGRGFFELHHVREA